MTISTIIPAYRAAHTIGRAVDSVLTQTRPPDEILVIDDGSPDDLAAALKPYGGVVTLVRKPNGGAADARNFGIGRAGGQFIAFLDADDYWEPTKLERQLEVFARHPEVGLAAGRFFEQVPGGPRRVPAAAGRSHDRVMRVTGPEAFELATHVWTSTVVLRREALGAHRFEPGLEPAEDRDLWVRVIDSWPAYLLSEPLATAVLESGSLSRSDVDVDCGNMLRVVYRNANRLERRGLRDWEARVFRRWAAGHLGRRQGRAALRPAWERFRRQPFEPEGWWVLLKSAALALPSISPRLRFGEEGTGVGGKNLGIAKHPLSLGSRLPLTPIPSPPVLRGRGGPDRNRSRGGDHSS